MNISLRDNDIAGRTSASPGNCLLKKRIELKTTKGFTLVELMTVIAVMGILSAVAIPAFIAYLQKAKTSEAVSNVQKIYSGSVTYYDTEHVARGMHASTIIRNRFPCELGTSQWCPDAPPGAMRFPAGALCFHDNSLPQSVIWKSLDFQIADHHYYRYQYVCTDYGTRDAFIARANGNLDGDTISSIFERSGFIGDGDLVVGSPGVFMLNPLE